MDKIFENAFVADRRKIDLVPLIVEELSVLPPALLKFVFSLGGIPCPLRKD
jgi:hypothetical protein